MIWQNAKKWLKPHTNYCRNIMMMMMIIMMMMMMMIIIIIILATEGRFFL